MSGIGIISSRVSQTCHLRATSGKLRPDNSPHNLSHSAPPPGAPKQRKVNGKLQEWVRATRRNPRNSKTPEGQVESPLVWVGRAPQCRSRVPGSLEPIGASDPFLDKKTQDKEGGELCPGDCGRTGAKARESLWGFPPLHSPATASPPAGVPKRSGSWLDSATALRARGQAAPCCLLSGRGPRPLTSASPRASRSRP